MPWREFNTREEDITRHEQAIEQLQAMLKDYRGTVERIAGGVIDKSKDKPVIINLAMYVLETWKLEQITGKSSVQDEFVNRHFISLMYLSIGNIAEDGYSALVQAADFFLDRAG